MLPLKYITLWILLVGLATSEQSKGRPRPRDVNVEIINPTTIILKWKPPKLEDDNCPIKRYLIRLKNDGAKRSKTWKIDGARQSLSLHDLQEDAMYYVRLVAVTCTGKSRPSRWAKIQTLRKSDVDEHFPPDNITEIRAPGKPTYVRTRTFTDSVILSWRPPEEDTTVRGYMVGYGEGVPDVNWQYVNSSRRNFTIRNLKSATQYVISLRAFNNYGKGPVVYDLIYTREKTVGPTSDPSSPPQDLRAKILSPTTAWLQWIDPSLGRHQQITDNRYYNVHYSSQPSDKTRSVIVKALNVVLYELTPGTTYEFQVRTIKDGNASPFSSVVRNRTFESAPSSAPRSVAVEPTNATGRVHVSWRPPRHPNGNIIGYMVLYTNTPDNASAEWSVVALNGDASNTALSNLHPDMTYHFRVQARNSKGYGPLSSSVVLSIPPQGYNRPMSGRSVSSPAVKKEEEDEYDDDVVKIDAEEIDDTFLSSNATHDNSSSYQEVAGAARQTSERHSKRDKGTQQDVTSKSLVNVHFHTQVQVSVSAAISWTDMCKEPGSHHQQPRKYLLYFSEDPQPGPRNNITVVGNMALLTNLKPNTMYYYQLVLMGENETQSSWSEVKVLDTRGVSNT